MIDFSRQHFYLLGKCSNNPCTYHCYKRCFQAIWLFSICNLNAFHKQTIWIVSSFVVNKVAFKFQEKKLYSFFCNSTVICNVHSGASIASRFETGYMQKQTILIKKNLCIFGKALNAAMKYFFNRFPFPVISCALIPKFVKLSEE